MNIDPEDPRLTAYALGELEDSERAEFELLLFQSDEGRRVVEEVRETARLLAATFAEEVAPGLTPLHWKAIEGEIAMPSTVPFAAEPAAPWMKWTGYGIAASLLIGFCGSAAWLASRGTRHLPSDQVIAMAPSAPAVPTKPRAWWAEPAAQPAPAASAPVPPEAAMPPSPVEDMDALFVKPGQAPAPKAAARVESFALAPPTSRPMAAPAPKSQPGQPALGDSVADATAANAAKARVSGRLAAGEKPAEMPPAPESASQPRTTAPSALAASDFAGLSAPQRPAGAAANSGAMSGRMNVAAPIDRYARNQNAGAATRGLAAQNAQANRTIFGSNGSAPQGGSEGVAGFRGSQLAQGQGQGAGMGGMAGGKAYGVVGQNSTGMGGQPQVANRAEARYARAEDNLNSLRNKSRNASVAKDEFALAEREVRMADAERKRRLPNAESQLGRNQTGLAKKVESVDGQKTGAPAAASGAMARESDQKAIKLQVDKSGEALKDVTKKKEIKDGEPASKSVALGVVTEEKLSQKRDGVAVVDPKPVAEAKPALPELEQEVAAVVEAPGAEAYNKVEDNPFKPSASEPLSTFSIDVDTASYANIRRFLMAENKLPPMDAVRIEEMVNYFPYEYEAPKNDKPENPPFSVNVEVARCPWNANNRLAKIGLKGKVDIERKPSNLTFLVDVSGSMDEANKLPLVQASLRMLTEQLGENDRVAIVVYAGAAGLVLDSTSGLHKHEIASSIDQLRAGGSTAGGAGINLAYDVAKKNFIKGGVNRVILATDGDFNVGVSDDKQLQAIITEKAKSGVFLSVLGFGTGNLKDGKMEQLADKGNGNCNYIDSLIEARKVLVEQMGGTLITVGKDVKIQVDFNPAKVGSYRLIGYENRMLQAQDFANDAKDAGEIGAGHTVTALYELTPPEGNIFPKDLESKYVRNELREPKNTEAFTVRLRFKDPDGTTSRLIEQAVVDSGKDFAAASEDFKFASSVAAFGMILRDSPHRGNASLNGLLEWAESGKGKDPSGYRSEFCQMVRKAREIAEPAAAAPAAPPAPGPAK